LRKIVTEDLVYEILSAVEEIPRKYLRVGMDFGFEASYNAVLRMAIDHENKWLYIYWEYYRRNMTDDETADALEEFVETRECIKADSAEPKAIRYYQKRGFNMVATRKSNGGSRQDCRTAGTGRRNGGICLLS